MGAVRKWLEKRWTRNSIWTKVIFFLLFPYVTAGIITGYSFIEIWHNRHSKNINLRRHIARNLIIWIMANVWFFGFWFVIVPFTVVYLA